MQTTDITKEKLELLRRLRESESKLTLAAEVPEECARVCPEEGSWSVLQVVEHITLADRAMLKRFKDAGPNPGPINLDVDEFVQNMGRDTESRRQAPPHVQPAGGFATLADALNEYRRSRSKIVAFVESSNDDFRKKLVQHPLREMDGYQLFLLIAAHSERHTLQIQAIKRSAAYQMGMRDEARSAAS